MARRRARKTEAPGSYRLADEDREAIIDVMTGMAFVSSPRTWIDPANAEVYEPRESSLVPKVGAWAMITRRLPALENGVDEHLRVGRIFFLEQMKSADEQGYIPGGQYKVQCRSPWGTCCLWPYEYSVMPVARVLELWQAGEVIFHPTGKSSGEFNMQMFYARTRGIGLADAMVMALGTLTITEPIGWFEPADPEVAATMEAMAERIHRPLDLEEHRRRRLATRERRKS